MAAKHAQFLCTDHCCRCISGCSLSLPNLIWRLAQVMTATCGCCPAYSQCSGLGQHQHRAANAHPQVCHGNCRPGGHPGTLPLNALLQAQSADKHSAWTSVRSSTLWLSSEISPCHVLLHPGGVRTGVSQDTLSRHQDPPLATSAPTLASLCRHHAA